MSPFTDAKAKAFAALDQVSDVKRFFDLASEALLRRASDIFVFDRYEKPLQELASQIFKARIDDTSPIYNGLFLQIYATFEEFFRDFIEAVVIDLDNNYQRFDELPEKVRNQNIITTGRILSRYGTGLRGKPLDFNLIISNIGTCTTGSESFKLNYSAFSYSIETCTPDALTSHLSSVGIDDTFWDEISKHSSIQRALKTSATRETRKLLIVTLEQYSDIRNRIAHAVGVALTANEVDEGLTLYRGLIDSLCDLGDKYVR